MNTIGVLYALRGRIIKKSKNLLLKYNNSISNSNKILYKTLNYKIYFLNKMFIKYTKIFYQSVIKTPYSISKDKNIYFIARYLNY